MKHDVKKPNDLPHWSIFDHVGDWIHASTMLVVFAFGLKSGVQHLGWLPATLFYGGTLGLVGLMVSSLDRERPIVRIWFPTASILMALMLLALIFRAI